MYETEEMTNEGMQMASGLSDSTVSQPSVSCSEGESSAEPVTPVSATIGLEQLASDATAAMAGDHVETGLVVSESTVMRLEEELGGNVYAERSQPIIPVDQAAAFLSAGLVEVLEREIAVARKDISDIIQHQEVVAESIQNENAKFSDDAIRNLEKQMAKVHQYISKLTRIRKDMTYITDHTADLKRRAAKLVMQHQKRLVETEEQRRRDEERDRRLVAQPAKQLTTTVAESPLLPVHRPPSDDAAPIGLQQPRT